MKRLIVAAIIFLGMTTSINAQSKKLDNDEYISILNTNFAEMNNEISKGDSSIIDIFKYGVDKGYLEPELKSNISLRDSINNLYDDMKDIKVHDEKMEAYREELFQKMEQIVSLLDITIDHKSDLLNSNRLGIDKMYSLIVNGEGSAKLTNKYIEELNLIYKKMNNYPNQKELSA